MGAILRLDGREPWVEETDVERVGVVTRTWGEPGDKSGTGRVWPIAPHRKPELRLQWWEKRRELRADANDVVIGHGGTLDYFELAPGWYLADSATAARGVARLVAFRVIEGAIGGPGLEVVTPAAGTVEGEELALARLSGWSVERLRAEREAHAEDLAETCRAEGLPDLVGTPRQVAGANAFRRTKLATALGYLTRRHAEALALADPADEGGHGLAIMYLNAALEYMRGIDDAGWWVAHRNRHGDELLRGLAVAGYRREVDLFNDEGRAAV